MQNRKVYEIEEFLADELDKYFGKKIDEYVVTESTDVPRRTLTIEFVLYNYTLVRLSLESETIFLSIIESGVLLRILNKSLTPEDIGTTIETLDEEVRLRIPDKYLEAKGWKN